MLCCGVCAGRISIPQCFAPHQAACRPARPPLYAGSVERIVELHDRGVFGNGPSAAEGAPCHQSGTRRIIRGPSGSPSPERTSQAGNNTGNTRSSSFSSFSQRHAGAYQEGGSSASPFADAAIVAARLQQVAESTASKTGQHDQNKQVEAEQTPPLQGLAAAAMAAAAAASGGAGGFSRTSASSSGLTSYPPSSFTPLSGHTPVPGATPISSLTPVALSPTARSSIESSTTTMSSLTTATGMTGGKCSRRPLHSVGPSSPCHLQDYNRVTASHHV